MRPNRRMPLVYVSLIVMSLIWLVSCQTESPPQLASPPAVATTSNSPAMPTATTNAQQVPNSPPATPSPPPPIIEVIVSPAGTVSPDDPAEPDPASTMTVPEGVIGPLEFPPNVNPLTGESVSDPAMLARRPVAIKISNAPPIVRPQSGLNNADLIFEHYAEGGLTRFTALFYGKDADPVGSVRSGRLLDVEVPQMYDAAFAYSGSSGPLQLMFRNGSFFDRIVSPDFGHGGFFRIEDPNKAFEHTLFTSTYNLRRILQDRGQNHAPQFASNMAFSPVPLAPGEPATRIEIRYDATIATWAYNASDGRYYRWTDGILHVDANTGAQLSFKNIVVVAAHHEDTDILEDNVAGGHYSIQIQIWGEGPVSVFRDGQRTDGQWHRDDPGHMLTFTDLDGNLLPLAPGNSFFQIVPLGFDRLNVTP